MPKKNWGHISTKQIAKGIQACIQNARDLLEDAELLTTNKRYARALTCLLTAEQEIGKISVLTAMARTHPKSKDHWKDRWDSFYEHYTKVAHALMNTVSDDARTGLKGVLDAGRGVIQRAPPDESLRQQTLYVDFNQKNWWIPSAINASQVQKRAQTTKTALTRVLTLQSMRFFTEKALSIQREELSPLTRELDNLRLSKLSRSEFADLQTRVQAAHTRFFKRLLTEGVIKSPPANFTMYGKPYQDFLAGVPD